MFDDVVDQVIGLYWPFRGEPDLRSWLDAVTARGRMLCPAGRCQTGGAPRLQDIGAGANRLIAASGTFPFPRDGTIVSPDVIIAPLVGFDRHRYRLGYGGGFYDRTLAAFSSRPMIIGVGFTEASIATIHPQPHDIPMDTIVTEVGVLSA